MRDDETKRRWCQFSLRALLLVMIVSTVAVGGVGSKIVRARTNRERTTEVDPAVSAIENLRGNVTTAERRRRPQTWLEKLFDDPGGPDDPVRKSYVWRVSFFGVPEVTDAGLNHVKGLTELRILVLESSKVTDAGLENLSGLINLQNLVRLQGLILGLAAGR